MPLAAHPIISIILPCKNASQFLPQCLDSLKQQTVKNWELLAVDDDSHDNSLAILQSYKAEDKRIKIFSSQHPPNRNKKNKTQKTGGAWAARNLALHYARGQYILWQDADDYSHPQRAELLLQYLKNHPEAGAVGSGFFILRRGQIHKGKIPTARPGLTLQPEMLQQQFSHYPTFMIRQPLIKNLRYRPFPLSEDLDFFLRLQQTTNIHNIATPLYYYRKHGHNSTRQIWAKTLTSILARLACYYRLIYQSPHDPLTGLTTITSGQLKLFLQTPTSNFKKDQTMLITAKKEIRLLIQQQLKQLCKRPWLAHRPIIIIFKLVIILLPMGGLKINS